MQDEEVIREFLIESHENLGRLDRELVELEARPDDANLLGSIFRTVHTIKGTCGFLGFRELERITHDAESLLSHLRAGTLTLTPALVSVILETVDATRKLLAAIEATGEEGSERFDALVERLRATDPATAPASAAAASIPAPQQAAEAAGPSEELPGATAVETAPAPAPGAVAGANIRVNVGLLDKLMDLVGELVLTRNQILQFTSEREDAALNATSQRLNLITTELQDGVMKTRMQPIGIVWNKLPRVVRDIALSLGKKIRLETEGADTELDRTIIEAIHDPLVHLVRNACDHGIEPAEERLRAGKPAEGKLSLRAWHEGGQVNIEIGDDGAGVDLALVKQKALEGGLLRPEQLQNLSDRDALNLIFHAGLSTAPDVTNLSGRGVGMDVVRSHIEQIGGVIEIFSVRGEGTCVKLKIPLTLAIIPGLVVTTAGERFVIPQASLCELIHLKNDDSERRIESVNGVPVYRRRGKLLPIARLNEVLCLKVPPSADGVSLVVLQAEDRQFGLVVDGISDTQEIVVKPLGKQLKGLEVYAGATIMGDGRVALILDVTGIGQRAGVMSDVAEVTTAEKDRAARARAQCQRLLLFRAGCFGRLAVPLSLVARLEEIPRDRIESAGRSKVVQYRGQILPLLELQTILDPSACEHRADVDPIPVIVFRDGERSAGLIVDQIIDVVEEAIEARQESRIPGVLGSAVVGASVTDFLDLSYVLTAASAQWQQHRSRDSNGRQVLLAEENVFTRGLIRSSLDMAGYDVIEAATVEDALEALNGSVDLVVTGMDVLAGADSALLAHIRRREGGELLPVIALTDGAGFKLPGFDDCVPRLDRELMVNSLARLSSALSGTAERMPLAGRVA